jgi:hypothetical protein
MTHNRAHSRISESVAARLGVPQIRNGRMLAAIHHATLVLLLATPGCDPSDDEKSCSLAERDGTYLMVFEDLGGTCGSLPPQVVRLDASAPVMGCGVTEPDLLSQDACQLTRTVECDEPALGKGFRSKAVMVSTQEDDRADLITGTFTITIFDADDEVVCGSTYNVEADRE